MALPCELGMFAPGVLRAAAWFARLFQMLPSWLRVTRLSPGHSPHPVSPGGQPGPAPGGLGSTGAPTTSQL